MYATSILCTVYTILDAKMSEFNIRSGQKRQIKPNTKYAGGWPTKSRRKIHMQHAGQTIAAAANR